MYSVLYLLTAAAEVHKGSFTPVTIKQCSTFRAKALRRKICNNFPTN